MSIDLFASARFRMQLPEGVDGVSGGLIMPAALPYHTLVRRRLESFPHLSRRLLDPQLYLAGLAATSCRKACVNLASYGWFPAAQSKYSSAKQTQATWRAHAAARIHSSWSRDLPTTTANIRSAVRSCLEVQSQLECEALILPSPLTTELATDYSTELAWLDAGLEETALMGSDLKRIATIAISDTCLRPVDPWSNQLLEIIIDQVTARDVAGVYLVLELANENGYYCSHPNTVGSLLRLVHALAEDGRRRVIVAFAGMLGLLAITAGADTWSTGWYRGERRLKLADLQDQTGRAHPSYYSHRLASELHLEEDLDRVVKAGLLPSIADVTSASSLLIKALKSGRTTASVAGWANQPSNIAAAQAHFLTVAARETERLRGLSKDGRLTYGADWVAEADRLASELYKIGSFHHRTELNHQAAWKQAYKRFLSEL